MDMNNMQFAIALEARLTSLIPYSFASRSPSRRPFGLFQRSSPCISIAVSFGVRFDGCSVCFSFRLVYFSICFGSCLGVCPEFCFAAFVDVCMKSWFCF